MPSSTSIPTGNGELEVPGAPDVIWLNGAFGVGKTTVAELLLERIEGAAVVDPELVGTLLRVLLPSDWQTADFQDMPLWRSLTREAIGGLVTAGRVPLVIPMTVVRPDYLDELVGALRRGGIDVRHFTLLAPAATILSRLVGRDDYDTPWARDRVVECVGALADPRFAEHIDADARDPREIVADVVERLTV